MPAPWIVPDEAEAAGGTLVTDDRRRARVVGEQVGGRYRGLVRPLMETPGPPRKARRVVTVLHGKRV
jgi:hypothetical protein